MIETTRCKLRNFEEKDIDLFMDYRNNDEWMKYQSFKNLTKDEYMRALLVPMDIESGMQLAIAMKDTDRLLGDIYLEKKFNNIFIGYSINPVYSRKGYVTEVLKALLIRLQQDYSDSKILATTEKENLPSKNLLIKLGFKIDNFVDEWQEEVYVYEKK
jgi:RimJ/RimL family protein N-acetyltransferase